MILADTSVWIDHLRSDDGAMRKELISGNIAVHPFVVGEVTSGSLHNRADMLHLLDLLPHVRVAQSSEVRAMIEAHRFYNHGIAWTDAHLIASVMLTPGTRLWTRNRRLRRLAEAIDLHVQFR